MTNAELASLLGMSESGVSRMRNGLRRPSWVTFNRVAKAFGWPAHEQFDIWNTKGGRGYSAALAGQIENYKERESAVVAAAG